MRTLQWHVWATVFCSFVASIAAAPPAAAQQLTTADASRHEDVAAARALLARPITVRLDHVSLTRALDLISESVKSQLIYQHESTDTSSKVITVHAVRIPLRAVLDQVLDGTGLDVVPLHSGQLAIVARLGDQTQSTGSISGTITDPKTKRPVVHAVVTLDDTVATVYTDEAGRYRFRNVVTGSHRITARAVGFARQTRMVTVADNQTLTLDVALESSVNTLDQVVVTATGEQRIRELGHVVSRINADSLVKEAPIADISDLLQSRVPGLQISTGNGGMAGGEIGLRLRGATTLYLDPEPIVIVDGVRYKSNNLLPLGGTSQEDSFRSNNGEPQSPLNNMNPNDIETIEVVKGPSASTLYGPDAANGVILITTKRGTAGKTKFQWYARPVSNEVPQTTIARGYQIWSHDSSGALYPGNCTLVDQYKYGVCILDSITVAHTPVGDDRYSILAKSRPEWQGGASVSGGAQTLRYFLSGNFDSQTGVLQIAPAAQQYLQEQLGLPELSDAIRNPNALQTVGARANISSDVTSNATVQVTAAYTRTDHRTVSASAFSSNLGIGAPLPGTDTTNIYNYLVLPGFSLQTTEEFGNRFTGAMNGTAQLRPWLSATATAGLDLGGTITHSILPAADDIYGNGGYAQDDRRDNVGRTITLGMTAIGHPGRFSFRTSLGLQYMYAHLDGLSVYGYGLAPGSTSIQTITTKIIQQVWNEVVSLGTYGEEVIGVNERLFLTGSLRFDGSTSFGDAYHARPYPKIGLSWIASEEPWLKATPGLQELRFRGSFGAASRYPTSEMKLGSQSGSAIGVEGGTQNTVNRNELANPLIHPERTRELEYGVDATVLSNIVVGLTWYRRRTDDQIQRLRLSAALPTFFANVGDLQAHGFEATVAIPVFDAKGMRGDMLFAYAHHTDKLVSLGSAPENRNADGTGYALGYPLGSVFGYPISGVVDTVGNHKDGIVFPEEVVRDTANRFLGVMNPPTTYTFTPMVSFLNSRIRISGLFDRETNFVRFDQYSAYCAYSGVCLAPFLTTTAPLIQARYAAGGQQQDFLVPGDFTRWREMNITVDLPERWLQWRMLHLKFSRASVSLQGRNLALWTAYQGTDPESQEGGINYISSSGIPQARSWSFRFDITP